MLGRGVPTTMAYICLPEKEDLEKYKEMISENENLSHVLTEKINEDFDKEENKKI